MSLTVYPCKCGHKFLFLTLLRLHQETVCEAGR